MLHRAGTSVAICLEQDDTISMSWPADQRHQQRALRHRLIATVAALLLILHWAAPSFRPFDPLRSSGESIPSYTLAEIGPSHGTLPRLLARTLGVEIVSSKPKRNCTSSDGSEARLPDESRFTAARSSATLLSLVSHAPRRALLAHSFDARAPPSPVA